MADYVIILCQKHIGTSEVLLVLKDKPDWQRGRLNLPGGKIEAGESPEEATIRELHEETGYIPWMFPHPNPEQMGLLQDGNSRIFCYKVVVDGWYDPNPRPEETQEVFWMSWGEAERDPRLIPNLRVIIPLMRYEVRDWIIEDQWRSSGSSLHDIKVRVPTLETKITNSAD